MKKTVLGLLLLAYSCGHSLKDAEVDSSVTAKQPVQQTVKGDSLSEAFLIDTIGSLPEVEAASRHIDSLTNHEHGVSILVDQPSGDERDYYISVGYNGDERFEAYYHFFVNPQTRKILVDDAVSGEKISLEDWRKQ